MNLTPLEFRLLSYFLQNPGRLLTHGELLATYGGRSSQARTSTCACT